MPSLSRGGHPGFFVSGAYAERTAFATTRFTSRSPVGRDRGRAVARMGEDQERGGLSGGSTRELARGERTGPFSGSGNPAPTWSSVPNLRRLGHWEPSSSSSISSSRNSSSVSGVMAFSLMENPLTL